MKLAIKRIGALLKVMFVFSILLLGVIGHASTVMAQTQGTFIATGDMITPRVLHTATLLPNGKVLITGGAEHNQVLATAEVFDPDTGTFSPAGNMTIPRVGHSASLLPDGRVLIAGGRDSYGGILQASAEIYDPSTGTFTPTGNMVVPQELGTAALLNNGKVFISGPCTDGIFNADLSCCRHQLYNPAAGTFNTAEHGEKSGGFPDLNCGAALLPNGKVLIGSTPELPSELYDPATDTLRLTGQRITIGFYGITVTLLTNGKVLIVGGDGDLGYSGDGELYDPSTGEFTAAGNQIDARASHTATLLRDGTVLIAGGRLAPGGRVAASSAALYDPATATFISTGDMAVPRAGHTATLLMDGRVLMVGGDNRADLVSPELYVPSVLVPAQVITDLRFDRTSVVSGSSYSVEVSGSNLTPETFLDVRFISTGSKASDVVLNWQRGIAASHVVPAGTATGSWTISGVRAHEIETDHTGNFFPVSATITVSE